MKTQEQGFKWGKGVRVAMEWRGSPWWPKQERGRKKVLLEVPVCCPLACSGHFEWCFQFSISIRRENIKLEQMWRRAVGM